MNQTVPLLLLGPCLIVFTVCAVSPYDRAVWWAGLAVRGRTTPTC
ncbi:MAG: hypothetical protein AB1724_12670 [Thermodesulfobacteriota bacterium]